MGAIEVGWWSASIGALSACAFDELVSVCSAAEFERAEKFLFERDRSAYLAAHGLLRHALSAAQPGRAPAAWRFRASPYGKPELHEACASRLRFNLSHCATRVNCVVCPQLDCGIDVEPLARRLGKPASDLHFLAPAEQAWLAGQPEGGREGLGMRFWTLKEALAKAVGLGLHLPFAQLEFELAPVLRLKAAPAAASGAWWLSQAVSADGHVESLALRSSPSAAIDVVRREWGAARERAARAQPLKLPVQPWSVW